MSTVVAPAVRDLTTGELEDAYEHDVTCQITVRRSYGASARPCGTSPAPWLMIADSDCAHNRGLPACQGCRDEIIAVFGAGPAPGCGFCGARVREIRWVMI